MTRAAEQIEKLISYSISDWAVTDAEEVAILGVVRADITPTKTVMDLSISKLLDPLLERVTTNRRQLVELLGARIDTTAAALIRRSVAKLGNDNELVFTISNELQMNLTKLLPTRVQVCRAPTVRVAVAGASNAPFTGSGATGSDPATLSIPVVDQALLLAKHLETTRRYTNPIPGSLPAYLATLTAEQRKGQALTLLRQPIVSFVPSSYATGLPDRATITEAAAALNNLDPATVAAFILAEQRDQSRNEDAKDLVAATSVKHADTSIGLGQVVVSTVRRNDLFSDLLLSATRGKLSHVEIARLLASDEFNIFAVAKYIRIVANSGATKNINSLPNTKNKFPGISLPAFAGPSAAWPADNLRALGSEYTSKAWDDRLSPGWGDFVFEARRDIQAAGVF
jgi:hypothetical protein